MSTTCYFTAEGGTNGSNLATGGTGAGDGSPLQFVVIGTNGTAIYDNTHVAHGSLAVKTATGATATPTTFGWTTATGSPLTSWFRCYLYFTANPVGSGTRFFLITDSTGNGCTRFIINTSGKVVAQDSAGSIIITTTNAISLNQWVRVEGMSFLNASTGQMEIKLYNSPESTTPTETLTSAASQNTLSGTQTRWVFGPDANLANQGPYWIDDFAVSDAGYIGPFIPSVPQTLMMGLG
jgi:hypothetical protein